MVLIVLLSKLTLSPNEDPLYAVEMRQDQKLIESNDYRETEDKRKKTFIHITHNFGAKETSVRR